MFIFVRFIKNIFIGIELGLSMSLLPKKMLCFYNLLCVRFIRLLGGCCMLVYITNYYLCFHYYLHTFVVIMATFHGIFMLFTLILSIIYCIEFSRNLHSFSCPDVVREKTSPTILYITLVIRICFIVFMECVGFLGFNYIFLEIIRGIVDIKKCFTKE